jgi:hypothetical protein
MNEEMYLVDNNVLSHLSLAQRASDFFRTRCRLPSEVLYEAEGYPDAEALKEVEYGTSARVLGFLGTVMATLPEDNTSLVNLYANKGAADPMLVACALDGMQESSDQLFGPTWIIVSNDKAVRAKASEFNVESCTREEFFSKTQGGWST